MAQQITEVRGSWGFEHNSLEGLFTEMGLGLEGPERHVRS